MKRFIISAVTLAMLLGTIALPAMAAEKKTETISYTYSAGNGDTYTREMEKLNRGLVAIAVDGGVYLSWRLLDSEDMYVGSSNENVTFNIYEGEDLIAQNVNKTNFTIDGGNINLSHSVAPVIDGVEGAKETAIKSMTNNYFDIPVDKPADVTLADGNTYSYTINDASCGDLDGDGEYEIILKWDCHGQDNSNGGYTGNVLIDAYTLSGTKLWRVDLGPNIRAGAHYTQFLVYDFDGDGKAEMTCQTAPGSKDSTGAFVTASSHINAIKNMTADDNNTPYVNSGGYILDGDEFLTIFDCDGKAADTIYYPNQRISPSVWGDSYGNRVDRFTAAVAYMDGQKPYAVYMRGYYFGQSGYGQRQAACAVSYNGKQLECTHSFDTYNPAAYDQKNTSASYANGVYKGVDGYKEEFEKYVGNGNHNCTVADVDGDGKDEVITGALCFEFDNNSTLAPLWCTYKEHGDALHIGDYDPTHAGFEFFAVHEDGDKENKEGDYGYTNAQGVQCDFGMSLIDAATGEIMFHKGATKDTGRGMMANVGLGGYYQITGSGTYLCNGGDNFSSIGVGIGSNFRIYWDGDLYDELLDGVKDDGDVSVTAWNGYSMSEIFSSSGCSTANSTKKNPALTADLFGDWREEIVMRKADNSGLRVYSTTTPSDYKIKTLMQDPVYRSGVAAEQTAYNQPPHVGIYMASETFTPSAKAIEISSLPVKTEYYQGEDIDKNGLTVRVTYVDDSTELITAGYQLSGYDANTPGKQTVTVTYKNKTASFEVNVLPLDISNINGTYTTDSPTSVSKNIKIGSLTGEFTVEHTLTVNSMPANGNTDRNSNSGFLMKFTPDNAVGGGWYINNNNGSASIIWKTTSTTTIAQALTLGEIYTVRYHFRNVGDGTGAHVDVTITDSEGNQVGSASNLDLRNMTSNNNKPATLSYPLVAVDIYNQANANSTASVTISNAHLGSIIDVDTENRNATVYIQSANTNLYAAKYEDNNLINIQQLTVDEDDFGKNTTVNLEFIPDKIFCWKNMKPIELWENK